MTGGLVVLLTFCSALGSGLMAGLFFSFSAFIMTALNRLPAAQGIAAMQSIKNAALAATASMIMAHISSRPS